MAEQTMESQHGKKHLGMQDDAHSFSFGDNWQTFVTHSLTAERINIATDYLLAFLEMTDLTGSSFLDIGCGSGLSSLAAYKAGADKVISFDSDPGSVLTTETLKAYAGSPASWHIMQGSILDNEFLDRLECCDIVYSWGVLHHTGNMWKAIENAAELLTPTGLFYIALYTTTRKSAYWKLVKKRYNAASPFRKRVMELLYIMRYTVLPHCIRLQNPLHYMLNYQTKRGMAYMIDVRDWLGGYPYEDARIEEVIRFARKTLACDLLNIKTGEANTEYLFEKKN